MKHAEYRTKSEKYGRLFLRRFFIFHFVWVYVIIKNLFSCLLFLTSTQYQKIPDFSDWIFVKSIGLNLSNLSVWICKINRIVLSCYTDEASNLIRIRDAIDKDGGKAPLALIVLCGLSNAAYRRPDGVFVVPPTALKNRGDPSIP